MKFLHLQIKNLTDIGVNQIVKSFNDDRGALSVIFEKNNVDISLKTTYSIPFVFRGMHMQLAESPQSKYIKVISGKVFEFLIDSRSDKSEIYTFEYGREDPWLLIPPYFYHGYLSLVDTQFVYLCEGRYSEKNECVINIVEEVSREFGIPGILQSNKDKLPFKII